MTRMCSITALLTTALLAPVAASGTVPSPDPDGIRIHAVFSGGRSTGFAVGEPLMVAWKGRGKARARRMCWKPAPVAHAACSSSSVFRAPARAGRQRVTVTLTNGTVIGVGFVVRRAATELPGGSGSPAVPLRVTCETRFFANGVDGRLRDEGRPIAVGGHVAAYYRADRHHVLQIFEYASGRVGFARDTCLKPLISRSRID